MKKIKSRKAADLEKYFQKYGREKPDDILVHSCKTVNEQYSSEKWAKCCIRMMKMIPNQRSKKTEDISQKL